MKILTLLLGVLASCLALPLTAQNPAVASRFQWVLPAVNAPRIQHRIFDSAAAKTKVSYYIYTPEVYDMEKEKRFPVLYWLHGSGGGIAGVPQLAAHFDAAIRAGKIPPMLVVFPNGLPNGMWCDWEDGTVPMETIVIQELLPHIDAAFRTIAAREGRMIEGFSMGGYGAARLGFKHHTLFADVALHPHGEPGESHGVLSSGEGAIPKRTDAIAGNSASQKIRL